MKRSLKLFLALILFGIIGAASLNSCKKKDKEKPVITITAPANHGQYKPGDTILVQGTVSDENLHEVKLSFTYEGGTTQSSTEHVHENPHKINTLLVLDTTKAMANFTIEVSASDHEENTATESISGHVMP